MVQVTREQKKTLRKFLELAYRRDYVFDEDLWGIQTGLAPTEGYWGTAFGNVDQGYWDFHEYRNGLLRGAHAGLNAVFNIKDKTDWTMDREQMTRLIIGQVKEYLGHYFRENNIEKMKIYTSRSSIVLNWEIAWNKSGVPGMLKLRNELISDYLEGEEQELADYFNELTAELLIHVKNAEEGDKHVRLGLVNLANYAYAFWHTEEQRFQRGETNSDDVSEEAQDAFSDFFDSMDRLPADNPDMAEAPSTVTEALSAFMSAYKRGTQPIKLNTKYLDLFGHR